MPASNNVFQKNANTSLVAQLIWRQGGLSRVDISRLLQLNKSTVSNIISYLMEIGLVSEGERKDATSLGGRKPIELTIARDFGCVFGFDLQPSHYRSVIMGADGSILWEVRGSKRQLSFESFVCSVVDEALNAHRGIQIPILALSFSIPGQIDAKNGVIIHSYPFALKDYHLKDFLKARYDYPIYIENDANCAAWLDLHSTLGFDFSSNAVSVVADFHEESKRNDSVIGIGAGFGVIIDGKVKSRKARVPCNGGIQRNRVAHFDRFFHSLNGDCSCATATCINCHSRGNAHGKYHRQSKKNRQHAFSVFHVFSFLSL